MRLNAFLSLLATAAAAVTAVWALFNSVFLGLVPPVSGGVDIKIWSGLSSVISVGIIFILLIFVPKKNNNIRRVRLGVVGGVFLMSSVFWLSYYIQYLRGHEYNFPEVSLSGVDGYGEVSARYIRGEFKDQVAAKIVEDGGGSIPVAIRKLGGFNLARRLLWTEESQMEVENKLILHYVGLTALFSCTLFFLGMVVRPQDQ
jgi:hypothetical protein